MFFSDNKNVGYIRTSGERPDVTQALKLADAYTANTKLEGRIQCRPGSGLDISLVGLGGTYGFLGTKSCP